MYKIYYTFDSILFNETGREYNSEDADDFGTPKTSQIIWIS